MSFDPLFDSESDLEYIARKSQEVMRVSGEFAAACPTCGNWPTAYYDARGGIFVVSCCDLEARGPTAHKAVGAWCDKAEAIEDERRANA